MAGESDHSYVVLCGAGAPLSRTDESSRSFRLASCLVEASGRMRTLGSSPGNTSTVTLETSTLPDVEVLASMITWNEYLPGGSELAGTVYEQPFVGWLRKEHPNEHCHLNISEPQSVPAALHCAWGSPGIREAHASRRKVSVWPTVRSPPMMPPCRGSRRSVTLVDA